jgi:fructosamine-3-kinase
MTEILTSLFSADCEVERLTGGDINQVYKVIDKGQQFVVKLNHARHFPAMFEKEAAGLALLGKTVSVPQVENFGQKEGVQYLILAYIQEEDKGTAFWEIFARQLAALHQQSNEHFGLEISNYIGSLVQENTKQSSWQEFLINQRLAPMIEMAVNNGDVNFVEAKVIENFYAKINEIYPDEPPALLHGDLWSGNFLSTRKGPVFIDPATYYGHREMDLGMMQLFGGFDPAVFAQYNDLYPLEKGWEKRIKYNQLYPLLVHVNLFGRSYWEKAAHILAAFK